MAKAPTSPPAKKRASPTPRTAHAFVARVRIGLRRGVSDPEGNNTLKALHLLGFSSIDRVSTERIVVLHVNAPDAEAARRDVEKACRRLLTNPVVHDFHIDVEAAP